MGDCGDASRWLARAGGFSLSRARGLGDGGPSRFVIRIVYARRCVLVVEGLRDMSLYMSFGLGDGRECGIDMCGEVRPHGKVVWVFEGRRHAHNEVGVLERKALHVVQEKQLCIQ